MKSEPALMAGGFEPRHGDARSRSGLPGAVVMNMSYTGLGIARSLGAHRVPVTGLSATGGVYGNFTRYAKVLRCPDSKEDPEALLDCLLGLAAKADCKQIVFPTRDHDVVFLDRFRKELEPYFVAVIPPREALSACMDKWESCRAARRAGVPAPACWKIEATGDLEVAVGQMRFPCVLKPLEAHHWRGSETWSRVGGRKAICVHSAPELRREYAAVSAVERRALVQELVPGGDDQIFIAACYFDTTSSPRAGFTARKLVQVPEEFGTGCVVQVVDRPDLMATAVRLLREIRFTGIAEVEFKRDSRSGEDLLIEINPRPWDQHRLGQAFGTDLIWHAYCGAAGLTAPPASERHDDCRWVAEDVFLMAMLRSLWKHDGKWMTLWKATRGRRVYGIWQSDDPLPLLTCLGSVTWLLIGALAKRAVSGSAVPVSRRSLGKGVS